MDPQEVSIIFDSIPFILWHYRILSFYCSLCRTSFQNERYIKNHIKTKHGDLISSNFNDINFKKVYDEYVLKSKEKNFQFYDEKNIIYKPFYGFDIFQGYHCQIGNCNSIFMKETSKHYMKVLKRHISKYHKSFSFDISLFEECKLQCLKNIGLSKFLVRVSSNNYNYNNIHNNINKIKPSSISYSN